MVKANQITLNQHLCDAINAQLTSNQFNTPEEVIKASLSRLIQNQKKKLKH